MSLVTAIGLQAYLEENNNASNYAAVQSLVNGAVPVISTQYSICNSPGQPLVLGNWSRAAQYADIMIDTLLAGATGFIDHNMAVDLNGGPSWTSSSCDAPVVINTTSADQFYRQPQFYTMQQITKFSNNCTRIGAAVEGESFNNKVIAFATPEDRIVLIVTNP